MLSEHWIKHFMYDAVNSFSTEDFHLSLAVQHLQKKKNSKTKWAPNTSHMHTKCMETKNVLI